MVSRLSVSKPLWLKSWHCGWWHCGRMMVIGGCLLTFPCVNPIQLGPRPFNSSPQCEKSSVQLYIIKFQVKFLKINQAVDPIDLLKSPCKRLNLGRFEFCPIVFILSRNTSVKSKVFTGRGQSGADSPVSRPSSRVRTSLVPQKTEGDWGIWLS